jgi:hypothetical protein
VARQQRGRKSKEDAASSTVADGNGNGRDKDNAKLAYTGHGRKHVTPASLAKKARKAAKAEAARPDMANLKIALLGRPNVGKSTLFNRLAGRALAIVDKVPGVTRDAKDGVGSIADFAFRMVDTAGLEVGSECSCDVHLCSLHSVHENLTINYTFVSTGRRTNVLGGQRRQQKSASAAPLDRRARTR